MSNIFLDLMKIFNKNTSAKETTANLEEKFANMDINVSTVIEIFKEITKKDCYKISILEEEPCILDDKIGGKPYLPIGEEYPKDDKGNYLALLLQVNLNQIDLEGYPKDGILEIFTDAKVDYPCQYSIKYFKEGLDYQNDLPNVELGEYIVRKGYKIKLDKAICYMNISDYRFDDVFCKIINEKYDLNVKKTYELPESINGIYWYDTLIEACNNPTICIGGYPDFTQFDPRENVEENKDECLFKLDSNESFDIFSIGDAGILFALISKDDINNCNFKNAFVDWDCC